MFIVALLTIVNTRVNSQDVYSISSLSIYMFSSVQSHSHVQLFVSPWIAACQASLSFTISRSLPKLMPIESVMPSNHLVICCPLPLLPLIFPSIQILSLSLLFASGGQSIGVSASASDLPMNFQVWFSLELTGVISLQSKGLLQHHSSKASVLSFSAFFMVQLSHPYMTTGKTTALTIWTFVSKVMSLLFNMLSRLVITFLPRSKRFLISWLQSPSAVILEPKKNKVWHCFHCFPIYLPWSDGTRCHGLRFLNVEL